MTDKNTMLKEFAPLLTVVVVFAAANLVIKLKSEPDAPAEEEALETAFSQTRLSRKPASVTPSPAKITRPYEASIWASEKSSPGSPPPDEESDAPSAGAQAPSKNVESGPVAPRQGPYAADRPQAPSKTKSADATGNTSKAQTFRGGPGAFPAGVTAPKTPSTDSGSQYYCEVSAPPGEYRTPLTLTLSCSAPSKIRYCVSKGRCCDPENGATYRGPFRFAPGAGSYCVSVVGEHKSTGENFELSKTYSFNPDLPDLGIPTQKLFFQTTELNASFQIESQDFGTPDRGIEVVNLGAHDPGTSGLNWSCAEVAENYTTLTAPIPLVALPLYDTSTTSPTSALNLLLSSANLFYGQNHLAVMFKNIGGGAEFGSCATERITLEDFLYFQELPAHSATVAADGSELVGGFTAVGFFADPSGPASPDSWDPVFSAQYPEIEVTTTEIYY